MFESAERQDPLIDQADSPGLGQTLGQTAKHRHPGTADLAGMLHRRNRRVPCPVIASVIARKIDDQNRQIDPVTHHRRKGVGHFRLITPDKGVIIKGVCQMH